MTIHTKQLDVLLVGSGIMSATLGTLLQMLDSNLDMLMVERLPTLAKESSYAWNNAGTGHAGYCELNYTPVSHNGKIDIQRALDINASFELSLQFWASLVAMGRLPAAPSFINRTPHLSLVWQDIDIDFLRARYLALKAHASFADMEWSESVSQLQEWMPLIMQGRTGKAAATRVAYGSDVDFGALAEAMVNNLTAHGMALATETTVTELKQLANGRWRVNVKDNERHYQLDAKFVFLGAGGAALHLLQKSAIPEGKGYGGFPVSGRWLVCKNVALNQQHHAKVYGRAPIGAPPMSVPHLDTRYIGGQQILLFGPYAGFTTRFLQQGSVLDLFKSVRSGNLRALFSVACQHSDLSRYLINESFHNHHDRMDSLRQFYPLAQAQDWQLQDAGKRVQIIKTKGHGGQLEFGTELVSSQDGTLAVLLGASPGASIAVDVMLKVLARCFPKAMSSWQKPLRDLIPSYAVSNFEQQVGTHRARTLQTLRLL